MRVVQLRTLVGVGHSPVVAGHNPGVVAHSLVVEEHNPVEQVEDSKPEEQKEDLEAPSPSPAASTRKIPYPQNCPFLLFVRSPQSLLSMDQPLHCPALRRHGYQLLWCWLASSYYLLSGAVTQTETHPVTRHHTAFS